MLQGWRFEDGRYYISLKIIYFAKKKNDASLYLMRCTKNMAYMCIQPRPSYTNEQRQCYQK
jgi:hypothetical protein